MDYLLRGVICDGRVRVFIVNNKKTSDEIIKKHVTTPVVSAALSRLVSATLILGSMQKSGKLTIRVAGDGPIGMLVADANSELEVRAFAENKQVFLPLKANGKLDVGRAVGSNGVLQVVKDLGLKQNFNSQVALQSGELGDDFSYYFFESEQVPSVVALGALIDVDYSIKAAGGIILQLLPGAKEEDYVFVEEFAKTHTSVTDLLLDYPKVNDLAKKLFPDIAAIEVRPVKFKCNCNKERLLESLALLTYEDLEEFKHKQEKIEVICEFCNTKYYYDEKDIDQAIESKRNKEKEK